MVERKRAGTKSRRCRILNNLITFIIIILFYDLELLTRPNNVNVSRIHGSCI